MSDFDPNRHTFAEAGSSQPAKRWADSTLRWHAWRDRKKLGLVGMRSIRLTKDQIQKLCERGYLSLASKGNKTAEAIAIEAYLADSL